MKTKYALILLFIVLAVTRLSLTTKGHLSFDDELRYRHSLETINGLNTGNIKKAAANLFYSYGRPGYLLISLIPASIQYYLPDKIIRQTKSSHMVSPNDNLPEYDLPTYNVPSVFNVIITLLTSFFIYLVSLRILGKKYPALISTTVFSFLNISYVFIRHMLPYYPALLLILMALYLSFGKNTQGNPQRTLLIAFLSAFSLTIYQPYYPLAIAIGLICLYQSDKKLRTLLIFAAVLTAVLAGFELLAHLSGERFLLHKEKMTRMFTDSADDYTHQLAFIFWIVYLIKCEGIIGWMILGLSIMFLLTLLPKKHTDIRVKILYVTLCLCYLAHASMVYFPRYFIFFTRHFYMYVPFMVMASVYLADRLKLFGKRLLAVLLAASVLSFCYYFPIYYNLKYPRDLMRELTLEYPDRKITNTAEFYDKELQAMLMYAFMKGEYDILAVNARSAPNDFTSYNPIKLPEKYLIETTPHPMLFKTYLYNGHSPAQRKMLIENNIDMRAYKFR